MLPPALIVQDDGTFRHERSWRGSAIAMPVFALRSRDSVGAGEFQDLKKLVTLCHQAGMLPYKSLLHHHCVWTGDSSEHVIESLINWPPETQ